MTADDRTYEIPSESIVDCESCGWHNPGVTIWDDLRTGDWSYEFECVSCGHWNKEHGNALDRGAANVIFILWVAGFALIILGILGHSSWTWPLIGGGGWLLVFTTVIALFMGANQGENK